MLKFKDFLSEETHVVIDGHPDLALMSIDKVNEDLDAVTLQPFVNSALFVNAVRGTLERYGIVLPAHSNMQQLSMESEVVYSLGDSGFYVYMVHNLNPDGYVEGYASIVDEEELGDLAALGGEVDAEEFEQPEPPKPFIPPARRDDDSGNTAEYA